MAVVFASNVSVPVHVNLFVCFIWLSHGFGRIMDAAWWVWSAVVDRVCILGQPWRVCYTHTKDQGHRLQICAISPDKMSDNQIKQTNRDGSMTRQHTILHWKNQHFISYHTKKKVKWIVCNRSNQQNVRAELEPKPGHPVARSLAARLAMHVLGLCIVIFNSIFVVLQLILTVNQ
jgi:hypothetical protein